MDSKLPKNWMETELTNIFDVRDGTHDSPKYIEHGFPLVTSKNLKNGKLNFEKIKYISLEDYHEINKRSKVDIGDLLFSMIGTIGSSALIIKEPSFAIKNVALFKAKGQVTSEYLQKYLQSSFVTKKMEKEAKGTTQKFVGLGYLRNFPIPIPPLAEQERIVAKLDALFGSLEQVKTRMEKIPQLLKNFRQAILTQAVTGKLTEEWRKEKELEDMTEFVRELSTKRKTEYQKAVVYAKANKLKKPKKDYEFDFEKHLSRNSWCIAKLENLIYMSARIGWKGLKADEYTKEGPMFLSVHGLNYGENVNYDVAYHITQERYDESPEIKLQENDILLCKDGAGIGKLGIVKNLKEPATVNSSLLVIRGREALNYKYLYYFFAGPSLQTIAKERITGTAIPHLFQKDIKEFRLEIPSLKEQTEIVKRVESLFVKADKIEEKYLALKQQIDSLPQAILAKAFKGELVEQLPTDGNAADLLKEIQKLKAATETIKKKKK